jgi:hypothetical protein
MAKEWGGKPSGAGRSSKAKVASERACVRTKVKGLAADLEPGRIPEKEQDEPKISAVKADDVISELAKACAGKGPDEIMDRRCASSPPLARGAGVRFMNA